MFIVELIVIVDIVDITNIVDIILRPINGHICKC